MGRFLMHPTSTVCRCWVIHPGDPRVSRGPYQESYEGQSTDLPFDHQGKAFAFTFDRTKRLVLLVLPLPTMRTDIGACRIALMVTLPAKLPRQQLLTEGGSSTKIYCHRSHISPFISPTKTSSTLVSINEENQRVTSLHNQCQEIYPYG